MVVLITSNLSETIKIVNIKLSPALYICLMTLPQGDYFAFYLFSLVQAMDLQGRINDYLHRCVCGLIIRRVHHSNLLDFKQLSRHLDDSFPALTAAK